MKKINFKEIKILDINSKEIDMGEKKLYQDIGNVIYMMSKDIALSELAKRIYNGEEVELRDEEISQIKQILDGEQFPYVPMVKRQVNAFIDKI